MNNEEVIIQLSKVIAEQRKEIDGLNSTNKYLRDIKTNLESEIKAFKNPSEHGN
jgi:uncharacterized coiled-coil protein SlyX